MDHIPTPPGESSQDPESEYGELRSGRPDAGLRFPRDPDEEPHLRGESREEPSDTPLAGGRERERGERSQEDSDA